MKSFNEEYWEFIEKKFRDGYTFEGLKHILKRYYKEINYYFSVNNNTRLKVLDIGCGFGYFLKFIEEKKNNWELYGMDISDYAIKKAKSNLKTAKLIVSNVNVGIPFKNNYFDLVTLFDVIEHVKAPFNVLQESYRVLKSGGLICITTPNLNAIERLWKKKNWHGFNDPTHVYLFTPDSLKFLVERVGFKVELLKTPFHPLPTFLSELASKFFKKGGQIFLIGRKEDGR